MVRFAPEDESLTLGSLIMAASLGLATLSALGPTSTGPDGFVHVAVYRGPAGCEGCSEAAQRAIEGSDARYRVDLVGPDEAIDISAETLARYDLYVQPGGGQDMDASFHSFGDERVNAIRDFVAEGGGYLGLCMGAYLAGGSHLGLVPHEMDSEVGRPGFPIQTIEDAAIDLTWAGRANTMFFQDGAYLLRSDDDPEFRTIATYENGDIAAARYGFGRGIVVLSGPHPEADAGWFEGAHLPLERMHQGRPMDDLLAAFRQNSLQAAATR